MIVACQEFHQGIARPVYDLTFMTAHASELLIFCGTLAAETAKEDQETLVCCPMAVPVCFVHIMTSRISEFGVWSGHTLAFLCDNRTIGPIRSVSV